MNEDLDALKQRLRAARDARENGPADRSAWPVPDEMKGASRRDALLWYIADGWRRICGGEVENLFDHDFGHHVLRNGRWQLTLTNLDEFPDEEWHG